MRATASGSREMRAEILQAEQSGFDAIFWPEHHGLGELPYNPSPLAVSAFALGLTTELRAGTLPLLLPLHDPVRIAESAAVLHHTSDARFILGVGAGYKSIDFEQIGIPIEERGKRLDEGLDILQSVWASRPTSIHGGFYELSQDDALPLSDLDTLPLWLAAGSESGMMRAVRRGLTVFFDSVRSHSAIRDAIAAYNAMCSNAGVVPKPTVAIRRMLLGDKPETDVWLERYLQDLARYNRAVGTATAPWLREVRAGGSLRDLALSRVFVGRPGEVAELVFDWTQEAKVDYVILKTHWGGVDIRYILNQLDRAGVLIDELDT